jgi:hypothetical protein
MKWNKSLFRVLVFALFFTFATKHVTAQTCTIKGVLYQKQTGEPMLYTIVQLQGTNYGAQTDVNGNFVITEIPAGKYVIVVADINSDTLRDTVTLSKGQILNKKLFLKKSETGKSLTGVTINAAQQKRQTNPGVGETVIDIKTMKQIPTIGGQPDFAQILQLVPGAIFTGDQGGQLYIEGGQPVQNKVLLDGMTIFNPFHSIGLFSVFDADIISTATVYAGGFNAEYGDRVSSIMDIHTRDGNKKTITGQVDASPFGAHVLVEGPLIKNVDEDPKKASASFILSVKNSYLGQTSKDFYPWVDSGHGIPFNYADYYGKLSFNTSNGSKLSLFGFNYNDNVNYPGVSTLNWTETGLGTNFILVPSSTASLLEGNVDYSNYIIKLNELDNEPRQNSINTFNMGLKFTYFFGHTTDLIYGFDISGTGTNFDFVNPANREITENLVSDEIKFYMKLKLMTKNKKLIVEPGLRLQYYASLNEFSPEPRIDMKYNITQQFRFKAAAGIYSQNLISAIDEQDVVDLFYGILTSPPLSDIPSTFTEQNGTTKQVVNPLQKAYHLTAGFEYDPIGQLHIDVEGYDKSFTQMTALNYNQIYPEGTVGQPDTLTKPFVVQTGMAYGADISAKYEYKELMLYGVYSLGFVKYWDGSYSFPPPFDRRNNINLVISYTFGKDRDWTANIRWNYGSGFPFTQTQGFYPNVPFNSLGANYTSSNASIGTIYGPFDEGRLPAYHRLDVSIDKSFQLTQAIGLHINASVINVYNQANIFYINRLTGQIVYQLPILPTLSIAMTF